MEKYLNDPMVRSLQYQIAHGVSDIKLESNKGEQKIKNVQVPEGMSQEDQEAFLQKLMAEDARNTKRREKEEAKRKEAERQEALKKSDPWIMVAKGAGTPIVNGVYERDGEAVRNGGRVFKGPNGFNFSYESVGGGAGWILGKGARRRPRAQPARPWPQPPLSPPSLPISRRKKKAG